jgi:DNA-directed RNA polymerase subunit RPC12/RpoP
MKTTINLDKCPTCGGVLARDEETERIVCSFCNRAFTYEELKSKMAYTSESAEEYDEYRCSDCGGTIVTDTDSITVACPYCGSGEVLKDRITGKYHPDYIIPFRITAEQAKERFMQVLHYKRTTRSFKKEFRLEEVTSLFVPFWLYNTDVSAEITYEYITQDKKGNSQKKRKNIHFTETYDKVTVDASVKMDDDKMDTVEPYDYSELKVFDKAYFIGHKAERYDTDAKLMSERARKRIDKSARTSFSRYLYDHSVSAEDKLLHFMGAAVGSATNRVVQSTMNAMGMEEFAADVNFDFDSEYVADNTNIHRIKKSKVRADLSDYRYALFPVYIFRGKYRGKTYLYYVNGQTGKVAANFPFNYLEYYLSRIAGTMAGSFAVGCIFCLGAKCFIKVWEENNDMQIGISGALLFLLSWLAAFLLTYFLETKYNGKEDLRAAKASVGQVQIVQNAKNFRVPGTFKIIKT